MSREDVTVEEILIRYMIKYERLDQAIPYAFMNSNSTDLNIYIDLFGLFRTIYSRSLRTKITDYLAFTSGMVSMCGHYREYFKRYGIRTKIFLISSFNLPPHILAQIPDYNKAMQDKLKGKSIANMMSFNLELLEILCPYLPDIFYLKTEFESTVLIDELITREGKIPSLIISTDLLPIQLCNIHQDTSYIWPMKTFSPNQGVIDISPICPPISHSEHDLSLSYIIRRKNGKTTSDKIATTVFGPNFVLLEALNQFKERELKTIMNISTAVKIINETPGGTESKLYPRDIFTHPLMVDKYQDYFETIETRYAALDVGIQSNIFKSSLEYNTLVYENLNDPDAVNLINSKYFEKNPLDLFRL